LMCAALVGSLPATYGWSGDRETGYEMSDLEEREVERPGIDRRTLIKRTAVAGAVAWTAPAIIGSLASPAGAVTGGFPATCSYIIIVMNLGTPDQNGNSIVAVKVVSGATTCTLENNMSNDAGAIFSQVCGADTYSRTSASTAIRRNGNEVPAAAGIPCPVTVNGGTVTATAGNTIRFAIAHAGSCSGGGGAMCTPGCCGVTSCTAGC
jgi:hypothetical protein